jgi:uncharacterized protein (DUF305 family)
MRIHAMLLGTLLIACAPGGETNDTAATGTQTDSAAGTATTAANSNRPQAKDAEHEFLRMMVDHHEGLIEMASAAMTKASQSSTQGDAHQLHTKQEEEQQRMLAMIRTQYNDSITPIILPSNRAMIDSLAAKTGASYDTMFYRNVIAHHEEGVLMTDQHLGHLSKPEVRQMAERMKTEQQREIAEFRRKVGQ